MGRRGLFTFLPKESTPLSKRFERSAMLHCRNFAYIPLLVFSVTFKAV
jgi:hypothetical protein